MKLTTMVAGVSVSRKVTKRQKQSGKYVNRWKLRGARRMSKHPGLLNPKDITKKLTLVFIPVPRLSPQNLRYRQKNHQASAVSRLVPILKPLDTAGISTPRLPRNRQGKGQEM